MVKISVEVVEKHGLKELRERFENPHEFDETYRNIAVIIRTFFYNRFKKFQKGGGDWPPLKHPRKVLRGRKTRSGKRDKRFKAVANDLILSVTNTLLNAYSPVFKSNPGQFESILPEGGVEVGMGGGQSHPNFDGTVEQLGAFHHTGAGHLPVRTVAEDLSESVVDEIEEIMSIRVQELEELDF